MKKKVNLAGKLSLNKETIAKLNQEEEKIIVGGEAPSIRPSCKATCTCVSQTCKSNCPCWTETEFACPITERKDCQTQFTCL